MRIAKLSALLVAVCIHLIVAAQHDTAHPYFWPTDPLVRQQLDKWQDQKFGIIIHWGLYAVPGIIESWSICSEDWIERDSTTSYEKYKQWYFGLSSQFNPRKFEPTQWAAVAKQAGMRYLVFTAKHHDGFSMFDTKQSNFSIAKGPFSDHPRKDAARFVFDAFRKQDFMIGVYFSKPDWHSEYYWWPKYATADRNNNYDIRKYPWRWDRFKNFTHAQIKELMTGYGKIDILWLDGGWVRPLSTVNDEVRSWGARIPEWSQDIDMPALSAMARKEQPGLLIVDRTVHGPYEDYRTPEQRIPDTLLNYPWESCMTLANNWGYVPNDVYKSSAKVIHSLIEVAAKGGNLLLGVGPTAEGTFTTEATQRLAEIGQWMQANGNAIYGTRPVTHYRSGDTWFTRRKNTNNMFALHCVKEGASMPATVSWEHHVPKAGTRVTLLQTGEELEWRLDGERVLISLPKAFAKKPVYVPALVFSFEASN